MYKPLRSNWDHQNHRYQDRGSNFEVNLHQSDHHNYYRYHHRSLQHLDVRSRSSHRNPNHFQPKNYLADNPLFPFPNHRNHRHQYLHTKYQNSFHRSLHCSYCRQHHRFQSQKDRSWHLHHHNHYHSEHRIQVHHKLL